VESLMILGVVAATSLVAWAIVGRSPLGPRPPLASAVAWALEGLGLGVAFFALNIGLGMAAVLAARALPLPFVSLYPLTDATLLAFSLLQGFTFRWWWTAGR
jgi:hypothetical protein